MVEEIRTYAEKLLKKEDPDSQATFYLTKMEAYPNRMQCYLDIGAVKYVQEKYSECSEYLAKAFEVGRRNREHMDLLIQAVFWRHEANKCLLETDCEENIKIIVGNQNEVFTCTRQVLSRSCNYFRGLFEFEEANKKSETFLPAMNPCAFQDVLRMIEDPDSILFDPKMFHTRTSVYNSSKSASLMEVMNAALFLGCPLAEVICSRAVLDLEHLHQGNLFPHMVQAEANGCSTLLKGIEEYCRKLYNTLQHPMIFDNPMDVLRKPVDGFRELLHGVVNNGLAFFLILGWVEFYPQTRFASLEDLLDNHVIVEILTDTDLKCFDKNMYRFDVPMLDRVGKDPRKEEVTKTTWPKMTLLLTNNTDSSDYDHVASGKQGIWVHQLLDGTYAWKRLVPFIDRDWAENPGWVACMWDQTIYFVGGSSTGIWTFHVG